MKNIIKPKKYRTKVTITLNVAHMIFPKKLADSTEVVDGCFRYEPQEDSLIFWIPDVMIQDIFQAGKTEKSINKYPVKVRVYNNQTRFILPKKIVDSTEVVNGRVRYDPQEPFLIFYLPASDKELRKIQESYPRENPKQKAKIQEIFQALTLKQKTMIQNIIHEVIQNQTTNDLTRGGNTVVNRT